MANDISHKVVGGYFALPFNADASITYDISNPTQFHNKAVSMTGNREVGLAGDGDAVTGCIIKVEPADRDGVKVTVQMRGALPFINSDGAAAVTEGAAIVGAGGGDIRDAVPATDAAANDGPVARGEVTSNEGDYTVVVY